MISVQLHQSDLQERIDTARRLIDATHASSNQTQQTGTTSSPTTISREARGLVIVLLFASYENLLTTLTRTLLEAAVRLRVSNSRLRPGLRAFAVYNTAQSLRDSSDKKMFSATIPSLLEVASSRNKNCTIDTTRFPYDGSFMKKSQIQLWCQIFEVPNPGAILSNIWPAIDTVVTERNAIAHGRETPEQVGRGYSENEIRVLINDWHNDWTNFLTTIEALAQNRDFFRTSR